MPSIKDRLINFLELKLIEEIEISGKIIQFKEGDVIIDYNKNIKFMPIVLSGTIRVMRKDEGERELLLYYLSANESCAMAYSCCMEARKSEVKAIAEEHVEIIAIPHEKLDEWLIKYPSWKSYIFNSFTSRFNELLKSIESIAFHKLDERLINYLKTKANLSGKTSIPLSHQQISEELGTNRVVISRLLKQLENEKKLLLYRNEIKLLSNF